MITILVILTIAAFAQNEISAPVLVAAGTGAFLGELMWLAALKRPEN